MWCSTIVTANPLVKCIRFLRILQQISHFVPLYPVIRLIRHYTNHVLLLLSLLLLFNFSRRQLRQKYYRSYVHSKILSPKWHTHTHTRLTALYQGLPTWAGTRKVKPVGIFLKQETLTGSGISWAICKPAPRSRQITMPAAHHSFFLQARCPSCHPTNSVKALKDWSD